MNKYIEIKYPISKERLNKENFFLSLMQQLNENKLIPIEKLEAIQIEILEILKDELQYFTENQSSSVRIEVAESILLSIYYTIGVYLKDLENIMESVDILKNKSIIDIYKDGKRTIEILFLKAKELRDIVQESKLKTKNYGYNDTINDGVDMFFYEYDMRFAAHIAPCSVDYPLFYEEIELVGVEYIYDFLKKINIENKFCLYFENEDIEMVLDNYDEECEQLLINIFRIVLKNSLASVLAGKSAKNLSLRREDIKYIESKLKGEAKLNNIVKDATIKCLAELNIIDEDIRKYVINASREITSDINNALELNKLEKIFIYVKKLKKKILYVDRKSMDDERFRYIIDNIKRCKLIDEKVEIIKKEIESLQDLADLLESNCIFEYEFIDLFKSLDDIEIALLLKFSRVPIYNVNYKDFHLEWHNILYDFIFSLAENKKKSVLSLYDDIEL